jgi:hypothetical protein
MIDTYIDMRETIDRDKRASIARWSKQEKQIEKVIAITAGTYGDLRGLIGSSMQSIPALEGDDETDTAPKAIESTKEVETTAIVGDDGINPDNIPF